MSAPGRAVAWGAVRAVARHGLRRRWVRLVALGLLAGVLGAAVLGAGVVARRTATAPTRLAHATGVEDAEVSVFGDPALVDTIRAFPDVARSSVATMFVGAVEGPGVAYLAVRSNEAGGLGIPAVVRGEPADPAAPDEVVVTEQLADRFGVGPGDTLPLCLLTREEFASFDTGFGEPDGPCLDLQITGVGRTAGSDRSTNVFGGPALAASVGEDVVAGRVVDLLLRDGSAGLGGLSDEVDALAAANPPPPGAEEFPVVALSTPEEVMGAASSTARVLVGGLVLCAVVAAVVGLLLLGQALGRWFEGEATDQQVEAALGLTPSERALGRVLPGLLAAAVAAVVAAGGALVAGAVEPLGPLGALEPAPGWAPNVALALGGGVAVAVAVLALVALAARRAGRRRAPAARSRRRARAGLRPGRAVTATGLWLALGRRSGEATLPVRATLATVIVGVAGVTAALTFSASLERVGAEPVRWGWNGDVLVVDARAEVVADVEQDPRVGTTVWLHQVEGALDGQGTTIVSFEPRRQGAPVWTVGSGRLPAADDEVLLGTRLADQLDARVGDVVELALADGSARALRVSGTGIGPATGAGGLGREALVRPGALEGAQATGAFDELLVRAADPAERAGLVEDLAARYEVDRPAPPASVQDVLDLDRVPDLLAAYLGLVALAALGNGMAVVVRRRGGELATLRAIGLTPAQVVSSVLAAAVATAAIGLAVGVPLGLGVGRLLWWQITERIGLATDVVVPVAGMALVAVGAVVVAAATAAVPAWRAARLRPGGVLRAE